MNKDTRYLTVAVVSLVLGCRASQRGIPPSGLKLPFEVETVPQRPFEWELDVSGIPDGDELLQRVRQVVRNRGAGLGCAECVGGKLRVMGRDAFEAVASILSERNLLGPLNSKVLAIEAAYLKIELSYLPELSVDWRFRTHTNRVSDIVQYAMLPPDEAGEFRDDLKKDAGADLLNAPRLTLMDAQEAAVMLQTMANYVADGEVVSDREGTHFTPKIEQAATGQSVEVCAHAESGTAMVVNLRGALCEPVPAGHMVRRREDLQIGFGEDAVTLPRQESMLKPRRFDLQFVLRDNEAVLFTRHDFVYTDPESKRERLWLIMVSVAAKETDEVEEGADQRAGEGRQRKTAGSNGAE